MPARGDEDAVAARSKIVGPACELGGVALRGSPVRESEVDALGELSQMELGSTGQGFVERFEHAGAGPRARLGDGLRLLERLPRAIARSPRLCDDDPRARWEELGGGREGVEKKPGQ